MIENDEYLIRLSCYIHRNPLRAGIVRRLVDYPWSSYKVFAYGKKTPKWLNIKLIYSLLGTKNRHKVYREMVQSYSREEKEIWEDFRHGIVLGSQKFIDRIKSKYLSEKTDVEIPQKRSLLRNANPETILRKAANVLKCDTNDFVQSSRISYANKQNRDLLIYFLWSTGWYSNQEIGNLFGIGYSSVSRRVSIMKTNISKDEKINKSLKNIYSQIKV
ncbi:MAG: hypothetical protein GY777_08975 [Candidatus Brocadiaceae bacterium]|nr:hypothetical protein [Candidatus Brocadiaceae bacterium]